MQHSLEFEIRDRLIAYLANEISLHDFEDWFFPKTWDVDKMHDPALLDLVYQIKLDWAEFSNGDWTEKELRSMLRSLAQRYVMSSSQIPEMHSTSNKNIETTLSITQSALSVDIKSSGVYA